MTEVTLSDDLAHVNRSFLACLEWSDGRDPLLVARASRMGPSPTAELFRCSHVDDLRWPSPVQYPEMRVQVSFLPGEPNTVIPCFCVSAAIEDLPIYPPVGKAKRALCEILAAHRRMTSADMACAMTRPPHHPAGYESYTAHILRKKRNRSPNHSPSRSQGKQ